MSKSDWHLTRDQLRGVPLAEVTFTFVDLETTGGQSKFDSITEIGAVKIRGGEQIGTFRTFVNPEMPIPPFITKLTGITQSMVADAPRIDEVLGSLLDFLRDSVVVAHNAPFDISFLRAAASRHEFSWPAVPVLDTVKLARALIPVGTVPNHKLGTLAAYVGTTVTPNHRALDDALATADVLHYLFELAGGQGLFTFDDFAATTTVVQRVQKSKRHLAQGIPSGPGLYRFKSAEGETLYLGMSGDLRHRVASYFTASEKRTHMLDILRAAESLDTEPLPTRLEAAIREVQQLRQVRPPYNERDTASGTAQWLRIAPTSDGGYKGQVARVIKAGATHLGPYSNRQSVLDAQAALERTFDSSTPVESIVDACTKDPNPLVRTVMSHVVELSDAGEYEGAGRLQRQLQCLLEGARNRVIVEQMRGIAELLAAQRDFEGNWNLILVRHGNLVSSAFSPRAANPQASAVKLLADHPRFNPIPSQSPGSELPVGAMWNEIKLIHDWLCDDRTRLVHIDGTWSDNRAARFDSERLIGDVEQIRKAR